MTVNNRARFSRLRANALDAGLTAERQGDGWIIFRVTTAGNVETRERLTPQWGVSTDVAEKIIAEARASFLEVQELANVRGFRLTQTPRYGTSEPGYYLSLAAMSDTVSLDDVRAYLDALDASALKAVFNGPLWDGAAMNPTAIDEDEDIEDAA